jgi:hypothetical protein
VGDDERSDDSLLIVENQPWKLTRRIPMAANHMTCPAIHVTLSRDLSRDLARDLSLSFDTKSKINLL